MLVDDHPLCDVLCYASNHYRPPRLEAQLCLELPRPHRINFITYSADRSVQSESGWHGRRSQDVCTRTIARQTQKGGDRIITLSGFR